MEFKFRAIDDRKPSYRSFPSPSLSYFSEQALRVNSTMDPNSMHNPRDGYTIQREIEKERIRYEIIMAENVHRRLLEEEVRRELMMEREMARASEMSISIDERISMQLPASCRLMHPFSNRWLEDRFAFPGNRGMGFGHDALPPTLLQFSDAAKDEIRSALEVNKKDNLIMLAKPNPNLCGSKRKAATPPAGSGELPLMSSKKPKEWSCALCQVSATSERGLNEHLQGKKHKAKEAGLIRAQRMCNHSTSSMSKKYGKKIKLTESRESADQEMKTKVEEESVEANKTEVGLDLKMEGVEDSENKNEELPKKEDTNAKTPKENGILTAEEKRNHSTPSMSKKSGKKIKLAESRESADQEMKTKVEEESVEANKTAVGLDLKMDGAEDSENKTEELAREDLNAKTRKINGILTAEKTKIKLLNRKNFKFWCEDCQVGTHSVVVMEGHKRGKKHMARRNESKPNGAAVPAPTSMTIMAPSEPTEKAEDEDVVTEEGNEETTVIVTEKPEDEQVVAKEASEETTENVTEKVEDEDVVAEEANEETTENVTEKVEDEDVVAKEVNDETTVIVTEKPEDEEVVAEEAGEETTENFTEKVEDEDIVAKEVNEETAENVTGDPDGTGSSIVGDVVDPTQHDMQQVVGSVA